MIAEEYHNDHTPNVSIPKGITIRKILNCFKKATPFFGKIINDPALAKPLNEDKFTQVFVEQVDIQMRKEELSIGVKNQYSDLFWGTKGKPDFYFHSLEEGMVAEPIFIVEAKRLPSYSTASEKEYVIGQDKNGGLERFKIEKHGKGQSEFGMIGFVEENDFDFWLSKVNEWILDLSKQASSIWLPEELVSTSETKSNYSYLSSIINTISRKKMSVHHFWIMNANATS